MAGNYIPRPDGDFDAWQAKDVARSGLEGVVRPLVARLQSSAAVDDAERQALGITVPDREPTAVGHNQF